MDIDVGVDNLRIKVSPGEQSARLNATNNWNSTVIQAAGSVIMTQRETLPVSSIAPDEIEAVRLGWVSHSTSGAALETVQKIRAAFNRSGIAVVSGPAGMGKRASAIRAMWEEQQARLSVGQKPITLQQITADWEKPSINLLPRYEKAGYLLDVAAEIDNWENPQELASALIDHGNRLREHGSFLVVISSERGWRLGSASTSQAHVPVAEKAAPREIAVQHLIQVYKLPDRARWLVKEKSSEQEGDGELAHLITDDTHPADAAALAASLSRIVDSREAREAVAAEFQQWRDHLNSVFGKTVGEADDRALLIATAFLEGAPALTVQAAARKLLGRSTLPDPSRILAGPDLRTRFESLGVSIKARCTYLDAKPGLARAVLQHVWEQRPDFHEHLLDWVRGITKSGGAGSSYIDNISRMLVDLAISEGDERILKLAVEWANAENASEEQYVVIANMMEAAADSSTLGPGARGMLLKWSQDPSMSLPRVVAMACMTGFSDKYPRQALVRLRHVLMRDQRDSAVIKAEQALTVIATKPGMLPRVWQNIVQWITKEEVIAGRRAFLALVDPTSDPLNLQVLIAAAESDSEVAENLVAGWSAALEDHAVHTEASAALAGWAARISDGSLFENSALEILDRVVARHLGTSPVSALLFGNPGTVDSLEVVNLRRSLVRRHFPDSFVVPNTPEI